MQHLNPVQAWREEHGWSRRDVAVLAHIGYSPVAHAELGIAAHVHRAIIALVRHTDGPAQADALVTAYAACRDGEAAKLMAATP